MSTQRKKRAEVREAGNDPVNYTCGVCKQVHKFNPDKPYICEKEGEKEI